jgi:hypothetical protein
MSGNGKVYYYPRLSHLNLWQQVTEVVAITLEMSNAIQGNALEVLLDRISKPHTPKSE